MVYRLLFVVVFFFPDIAMSQVLMRRDKGATAIISEYNNAMYGTSVNTPMRGSMTYSNRVWYDSLRQKTYIATYTDEDRDYSTVVYVYNNAIGGVALGQYIALSVSPSTDNHPLGSVIQQHGVDIVFREVVHNDPLETFTGTIGNLIDNGNFLDGYAYPNAYILNDTIGIIARKTFEREQENIYSIDTASTLVFDRNLTGAFPVLTQPYPGVYGDWIDGNIVYYVANQRNFGGGRINYFRLCIYKATDWTTTSNIEETYISTSAIPYDSIIAHHQIDIVSNTDVQEVRQMGGYVDASNDLHMVYSDTDADSLMFLRTDGASYMLKGIPIEYNFQDPGTEPDNITAINDMAEIVHLGGDRYDLFVFNDQFPVYQYSTIDAFETVDGPFQITPSNVIVRAMHGTRNWRPGSNWPYVLAMAVEVTGISNKQLIYVHEYTPK